MKKRLLFSLLLSIVTLTITRAQNRHPYTLYNRDLIINKDSSIHLNATDNDGHAWINEQQFTSGTIEFDVKGQDLLQQSFVGIAFHGINDTTFEAVYFRPFNFKANDPERHAHAVQYIAVPKYDWPKLRAEYHNQYEKPLPSPPEPNGWFHVRISVIANLVSVYVNSNTQPVLVVKSLLTEKGTKIGYWVGNGSAGDFKNFRVSPF